MTEAGHGAADCQRSVIQNFSAFLSLYVTPENAPVNSGSVQFTPQRAVRHHQQPGRRLYPESGAGQSLLQAMPRLSTSQNFVQPLLINNKAAFSSGLQLASVIISD